MRDSRNLNGGGKVLCRSERVNFQIGQGGLEGQGFFRRRSGEQQGTDEHHSDEQQEYCQDDVQGFHIFLFLAFDGFRD